MRDNERFIVDLNKKRETAWQQLYEEFYPALCTYVAKLTHENVGVEDIVQECMIGLWDSSLQFPNVRSLAGWLYKAVYNRALNMIRDREMPVGYWEIILPGFPILKKWLSIWPLKKV